MGEKARGGDREAAIRLVRAACAQGRISELDRDFRVAALGDAQTLGEIEVHVRDLRGSVSESGPGQMEGRFAQGPEQPEPPVWAQPSGSTPVSPPGSPGDGPGWPPHLGPVAAPSATSNPGVTVAKVILILFVVLSCCTIGSVLGSIAFLVGGVNDAIRDGQEQSSSLADGPESSDLLTAEGYAELVEVVESETGSTEVLQVDIYRDRAGFVALRAGGAEAISYQWDSAGLREVTSEAFENDRRILDLADIRGAVVERLSRRAENTLLDDPDEMHTMLWSPQSSSDGGVIWSEARQGEQSAYLLSRADGSLVRRSD